MGRASGKVTLKQIQNEKVRNAAFIQRKKGLTKKVSEFSKSFGVEACLIVFDGDGKPMIWSQDSKTLQSVLTKYEQQKFEMTPKEFKVQDYFANKRNMVELEILRVRKKITKNKYPTWSPSFNNLGREQLKGFIDNIDLKIQECNQRINMMKNMQQNTSQIPEKVASPQSSQPMKPIMDIGEMKDFTDLIEWDDPMPQENVFSSQSSQLDVMHNIPQIQPVPAPVKPLNINEMVDLTDLIEWDDPMPQENVFSSHSSQLDVMHSIPTWSPSFNNLGREQLKGFVDNIDLKIQACNQRINMMKNMQQNTSQIPEKVASPQSSQPMKPIMDISGMKDFTDLIEWDDPMPQENVFSSHSSQLDVMHSIHQIQPIRAPLKPLDNINEMVDFDHFIDWDDLMPQKNGFPSHSGQLDVMHSIPQMQPLPTPLKSLDNISLPPVSSTGQLGEFGKLDDLMDKSDQEWVATQFDFDDSAANKLNDGDGWVKQPDMFQWNDISFLSEIEQECAALDAFPQPRYGF